MATSSYLHRFGIRESGRCVCGAGEETAEHVPKEGMYVDSEKRENKIA